MVKRKPYIPFTLALGAFSSYYAFTVFKIDDDASFAFFSFFSTSLIFIHAVFCARKDLRDDSEGNTPDTLYRTLQTLLLLLTGALLGLGSYQSRYRSEQFPLSLAAADSVTGLECVLTGEPVPFGTDRSRIPVRVTAFKTASGMSASASGQAVVLLDKKYAQGNYPGRLTLEGGQVLASGLTVEFIGSFLPSRPGEKACFLAETWDGNGYFEAKTGIFRTSLRKALMSALLAREDAGGLLLALLSGNREYLEDGLALAFRSAGLSHILALSGMHLSIIALIILRFGRSFGQDRLSIRLSLLAMLFFVWFAGPSPSLVRAVMMALLLFVYRRMGYKASPLAVLVLTALIQLILFPSDAVSPAYLLSYGALAGIFAFAGPLAELLPGRIPLALRSAFTASIGAQLATAGYTSAVFGTFVPLAFAAAIIVGPLATIFLSTGILWLFLYLLSPTLGLILYPVMEGQYALITGIVQGFAALPVIEIRDLSGILLAVIISFALAASIIAAFHITRKGRLPDAGFAGL